MTEATEMKPWQNGFDLEYLRRFSKPFAEQYKPYCHGAFGMIKERDIATALKRRSLVWKTDLLDEPAAVAIVTVTKTVSSRRDFRGRPWAIPRGSVMIHDIAGTGDFVPELIGAIMNKAAGGDVWIEIHEENAELKAVLAELDFEWVGTQISAGSDIKGVYRNTDELDRYEPDPYSMADDLDVGILKPKALSEKRRRAILAELEAYDQWEQHYSAYNNKKSWTAFALRGYDPADPFFIIKPGEMSRKWKAENVDKMEAAPDWTTIADQFPEARAFALELCEKYGAPDRVRFMRVAANGGGLTRHADITDREAGTEAGNIARLHIPIQTTPEVLFRSWSMRGECRERHFDQGALCYLDQRKPHEVTNAGKIARIHFVVDVHVSEALRGEITECRFQQRRAEGL